MSERTRKRSRGSSFGGRGRPPFSETERRDGRAAIGRPALAIWLVAVVVASSLPYLLMSAAADRWVEAGSVYTWLIPPYPEDGLAYLAWIKQAAEGAVLFRVKFTPVDHRAVVFHPVFLVVGWLSALTGWNAGLSLFVFRTGAVAGFLLVLHRFTGLFGLSSSQRWISLWMVVCSSGFGVLFGWERLRSADLWMPELNTLWSLTWNPIFAVGLTLMLLVFLLVAKADASRCDRAFLSAGALTGLLAFVHAYDVIPVAVVVFGIAAHRYRGGMIRPLLLYGLTALPACLLQWAISATHPVLSAHGDSGKMLSPSPWSYTVGLGLPALLAVYGVVRGAIDRRLGGLALLWIWIVVALALAYVPVWFQRKLIMGIHIPVCMFAAIGLDDLATRLSAGRRTIRVVVVVAILLSSTPTHLYNARRMTEKVSNDPAAYYITPAIDQALRYLDRNAPSSAVVLAHQRTARLIPGISGNSVTLGHWAQSVGRQEHKRWLASMFDPSSPMPAAEKQAALRASRIEYVFVDPAMRREWLRGPVPAWLARAGKTVYDRSGVRIIRVDRAPG